jgi:hypothetical protein
MGKKSEAAAAAGQGNGLAALSAAVDPALASLFASSVRHTFVAHVLSVLKLTELCSQVL